MYSPLTILANGIKGEKKEMILVNSGGLFENAQKKKRGERKIRGCNKIMMFKKRGCIKKELWCIFANHIPQGFELLAKVK